MRVTSFFRRSESEWISISDLMAGLMMIFLFIAISYMNSLQLRAKQIRQIAVAYQEMQDNLYKDLFKEFKDDLPIWQAEIDRETLTVRFNEPEVLFAQASHTVTTRFKDILDDFFPRYLGILFSVTLIRVSGPFLTTCLATLRQTEAISRSRFLTPASRV